VHGSVVIDAVGDPGGAAHLRWFIVSDALRGRGFGHRLMHAAMHFCDARGLRVFLTTFAGLDAARALYEQAGFRLADERVDRTWGAPLHEQRWVRDVTAPGGG
jgi:ribosomal protein S18 acetylase RimI-like enzyme